MKLRMLSLFLALLLLLTTVCTAAAPEVSLFSTGDATAGHHLTGNDKLAYDALLSLVKEIAKGDRSSTVLHIGAASPGNPVDRNVNFSLTNGESLVDHEKILHALLADCPYELYWYDKTAGYSLSYSISGSQVYMTFSFAVEQDYAGSDPYTVDHDKTIPAKNVLPTVNAIIEEAKNLDDYSKLKFYKDEICKLVSYNKTAASVPSTPYGDPWQLIHVFDGNPETNVVCEGYSKAFQYLCDNTEFNSAKIQCYTVSGDMYEQDSKGLSGGGHMWNIVTMEDSQHYLVDVTSSDDGSIGQDGELFLAGVPMTTRDFNYKQDDQEITITRNCHVFTVNNREVIFADDSYADVEHGYWDDKVLILSVSDYVYDNPCPHLNTADEFRWAANYQSCKYTVTCNDCHQVISDEYASVYITHVVGSTPGPILKTMFVAQASNNEEDQFIITYQQPATEDKLLTLPLAADETVSIMAVVYQDGQMIDIKTMEKGKNELSYLEFEGDYVKIFFLEKETSAPFLPNMQIDLH